MSETLREALGWCVEYIEGTDIRSRTMPPLAEPFFSERMARYRALATPPVPAGDHEHDWQCVICGEQHPEQSAVPAGDERDRMAAIIHEPCVERWRHRGKVGYGVVTMHGIDAHYELADRLLAAGFRLTEGGCDLTCGHSGEHWQADPEERP